MFFFSWSGKGYMVPMSAALSTLSMMGVTSALSLNVPDEAITAVAAMMSGVFVWKLHFWLERRKTNMTIVCDETGESVPYKVKHDFFWLPLKYWGVFFFLFGLAYGVDLVFPELQLF
jgi:hypothetical protein